MQALRLIGRRAAAMAIDRALLFLILWPAGLLVLWLAGARPQTGPQVYAILVLNFSLPAWTYFAIADASPSGQSLGKRLVGIRVRGASPAAALGRTAVKLAAWEMTHIAFFALAGTPGEPGVAGWTVAGLAYAVLLASTIIALVSGGSRSLHDLAAGTSVQGATTVAA